jgi:hypothetical protein
VDVHGRLTDELLDLQYGATTGRLTGAHLRCQTEIARAAAVYAAKHLKIVQKCMNERLAGKLAGIPAALCAAVGKNPVRIAIAEATLRDAIAKACPTDAFVAALDVCDPPADGVVAVQDCLLASHRERVFAPDRPSTDMIEVEYAASPARTCGDDVRNQLDEECDGLDAAACPGSCGAPDGDFPCLCLDRKRQRTIEHASADLDLGWSGLQHDVELVEGGGFVVDLYECDGAGDDECIVGPNCSEWPHSSCSSDAICAALAQGTCRKERTAVGPHCALDVQKTCIADGTPADVACSAPGDFCQQTFHGPPLPMAANGVAVCMVNLFSEDVVGTTNLTTGATAIRLRQNAITHLMQGPLDQPCPVCGGFCRGAVAAPHEGGGPGERLRCDEDADCPTTTLGPPLCVSAAVCSFGPNVDQPCRRSAPWGAATEGFGTPSVDCPPDNNVSGPTGLDILLDPATTGAVIRTPSYACNTPEFAANACRAALSPADVGRPCASDAECPGGGPGACAPQCFCPAGGGILQRPNGCNPACVSSDGPMGTYDGQPCIEDADCTDGGAVTGFCHAGDCRVNPLDTDSNQEGACTAGPAVDCFVPTGIVRTGEAGTPDRVMAATFCVAPLSASHVVNFLLGLPGPGALLSPVTVVTTGF